MGYKVAVVGATGNVGRVMLDILSERACRRPYVGPGRPYGAPAAARASVGLSTSGRTRNADEAEELDKIFSPNVGLSGALMCGGRSRF